jgi:hypothetical protein
MEIIVKLSLTGGDAVVALTVAVETIDKADLLVAAIAEAFADHASIDTYDVWFEEKPEEP